MPGFEGNYDELRPCPACGLSATENKSRFITRTNKKPDGTIVEQVGIERTCSRCNYQWHEKPLNA